MTAILLMDVVNAGTVFTVIFATLNVQTNVEMINAISNQEFVKTDVKTDLQVVNVKPLAKKTVQLAKLTIFASLV